MADVIFNGTDGPQTDGHGPKCRLTLGGVDGNICERRVSRSPTTKSPSPGGFSAEVGSEYFVNSVPCRLKEIQQLFMARVSVRTSYSIMAQGPHHANPFPSKPEDRA